jgi:hypothetical protein
MPAIVCARSHTANFKRAAPFEIEVLIALYKCEGCGREQVRSNDELVGSVLKAITHAFRAADVHPDR